MAPSAPGVLALAAALLAAGCLAATPAQVGPAEAPGPGPAVPPGVYATTGDFSRVLAPGPHAILPDAVEVLKSARDGVDIRVGLVRPDVPEGTRVPVVAHLSVYLPEVREGTLRDNVWNTRSDFLVENLVPRGYAVAFVAARGSSGSGGCWDIYGEATRADLDQAVTWLASEPWSTGAVGTIGLSFDAVAQLQVAAAGNPHLRTMVLIGAEPDHYSFFVRNGTVAASTFLLNPVFNAWAATNTHFFQVRGPPRAPSPSAVCPEAAEHLGPGLATFATGGRGASGYWVERDLRPRVEASWNGSILGVHGFRDDVAHIRLVEPWYGMLATKGFDVKRVYGQWGHTHPDQTNDNPTLRWDWAEKLAHWFDLHLKDDATATRGPPVEVADQTGRWRAEEAWPPRDATPVTYYLTGGDGLASEPDPRSSLTPLATDPARALLPPAVGPAEAALETLAPECRRCAFFSTEVANATWRFAGAPLAHVTVVPTGAAGHVTARLYVVNGTDATRVSVGQMDIRFAAGGDEPSLVSPGQRLLLRMQLEPADVVVPAGARLAIGFDTSGYGTILNHYRASPAAAPVLLAHGGRDSTLTLAVFDRADEAFFDTPR
ncbi:MAG TPA: CocE/NonD family hydrolase [Candidatus Thermoplasmatota archaeon]|nr:CocE/NonD family hydrolase [Candidatus Thermoplasmatota archaeon]